MQGLNIIFQLLTLILTLGLMGCAVQSSDSGQSDFASRATTPISNIGPDSGNSNKPLSYCNKGESQDGALKLNLQSYIANNTVYYQFVHILLKDVRNFEKNNSYIQFWKWQASSSGAVYVDRTPVPFKVIDKDTGIEILGWRTWLTWSDLAQLSSIYQTSSASSLFSRIQILANLDDPNGDFDALKMVQYEVGSNYMMAQLDLLLPPFHANPKNYAVEKNGLPRATVLQALHPFASMNFQGWSSSQLSSMAQGLCR
ncbi:MAG: hypothetical protein N2578_03755 [Bdellovibrionaceae bacterium]|nr:hypothetical protein [Pseudobdellovibrionaceae bacterium]